MLEIKLKKLTNSVTGSTLLVMVTAMAVMSEVFPSLPSPHQNFTWNRLALAQNFTDEELRKYAQAAVEIERMRRGAFAKIEQIVGKDKTAEIACHRPASISQLPDNARTIAENYCSRSQAIVNNHGLSTNQFNRIFMAVQQNPALKQKVRSFIRQP